MRNKIWINVTFQIFICAVFVGQVGGLEIDHWGRHFVLSFITIENKNIVQNIVAITARETTEVRVVFHRTGEENNFSITSGNSHRLIYDHRVTPWMYTSVSTKLAISVESSKPVSVYAYVHIPEKSEGFLVLPVASLGTRYTTVTYENAQPNDVSWGIQIVIIAVEGNTSVSVELPNDNECVNSTSRSDVYSQTQRSLKFKMDTYDVVNIFCKKDTTGSQIEASKPVAVLSGAKYIRLEDASKNSPIVEMLPPITEFGTEYKFVTPGGHTHRSMLRVVALHPDTQFEFSSINYQIESGSFVDIFLSQMKPVCFNSTKPVIVAVFMTGSNVSNFDDYYTGNAFMSIIPPVNKFSNFFIVPTVLNYYNSNFENRVDIVHDRDIYFKYNSSDLCDDYVVTYLKYREMIHVQSTEPVLILIYGYAFRDSYGFLAGMKLTDFSGSDECINAPCQNGGWCLEMGFSFRCYCHDSRYSGVFCETELVGPNQNNSSMNEFNTNTTPGLSASIIAQSGQGASVGSTPATQKSTDTKQPIITTDKPPAKQPSITTNTPSTKQPSITTDTPSTKQPSITTNTPSTKQPYITTDTPSTKQSSITTDTPSTKQTSITTDTPSTKQPSISSDTPSTKQLTFTSDTQSTTQLTFTSDTQSTKQLTFTSDTQSTKQPSISSDTPSTKQPFITTDTPSTKQLTFTSDTQSTTQPTFTSDTQSTTQLTFTSDTQSTTQPTFTSDTQSTTQPTFTTDKPEQADITSTPTDVSTTRQFLMINTYASPESSTVSGSTITNQYTMTYKPTNTRVVHESNLKPELFCSKLSCLCSCPCERSLNNSRTTELSEEIKKTLKVDKTSLSKTIRKKNCSKNLRSLEENIGQGTFIIVLLPFACLILADLGKVVYWLFSRRYQEEKQSDSR